MNGTEHVQNEALAPNELVTPIYLTLSKPADYYDHCHVTLAAQNWAFPMGYRPLLSP